MMKTFIHTVRTAKFRFFFWLFVLWGVFVFALVGPHFLSHDPLKVDLLNVNQAPGKAYVFGTDYVGRCIACRLISGAKTTIFSSLLIVAITFSTGTLLGTMSAYIGGKTDSMVMRLVDAFMAFPSLVFSIAVAGMLGVGMGNAIIAMSVIGWTQYARIARSQVLVLKGRTFIQAAEIGGTGRCKMVFKHILPNILGTLIVTACLDMGNKMLGLAGLAFLGLGAAPPNPEWGSMLNDGREMFQLAPWAVFIPGAAILIVVMIMNMFGDSMNELLDPRQKDSGNKRNRQLSLSYTKIK